ncbi:MAG: efflux RND transporter permease subunit [Candidatus Zixiibacteriota bacterium]|nr:MAG: efflux RND transporter permease subunit [candidate division Zixibacteria bacterium]
MYRLAKFSVRYPTTVLMAILAILLLGYISFTRLGVDLLPDLNNPRLFVEVTAGERPPAEMEQQFVEQLEAAAVRGKNVRNVMSISRVGRALITVEYTWDTDMDEAFLDLQKAMADYSQNSDADEITVTQHDPNAVPILTAVLYHPDISDLDLLRRTAENVIQNELIRLPGVAGVDIIGGRHREVEIRTDAFTLEAYGLSFDQLANTIVRTNRNMTGGSIVEMGRRYLIRGVGELTSKDDLENLIVAYRSPATTARLGEEQSSKRVPIYLREVADVNIVLNEPENIVRFDGRRCIALEIFKEARYNTIDAAKAADDQLNRIRTTLPGHELEIIQNQAGFISSAVTEVEQTGLIGIFLAVIVLFVFLRRLGVTAIISVAIPISIVATFNLMFFNELSLNVMTLGGLALGAGMLVDNAIVVVENIFRHLESGRPLSEAAVLGAGEVGGAITSSTLTTIVVFLPIVYLQGAAGELFKEQAWTVAYSLISSLFVALAAIPMLCTKFLRQSTGKKPSKPIKFPGYARFLEGVLRNRIAVVLSAFVLVVATILIIPLVGSEFMPRSAQGELVINLALPEGTSLDRTEATVRRLEDVIREKHPSEISHVYSRVGPTGASADEESALADENNAEIHLLLKPEAASDIQSLVAGLDHELSSLPNTEAYLSLEQTALKTTLGTTTAPLVVEIKGEDLDVLYALADTVRTRLAEIPDLTNLETSFREGRPEINIRIDRTVAAQFSLEASQIGTELRALLSGREAGQMQYQGDYTDIMLRRPEISLGELEAILLESPSGRRVRLDEIARLDRTIAPREITRNNQTRVARVTGHIASDEPFDHVADRVRQEIYGIAAPPEYYFDVTGEEKLRQEAFGNLGFALLLAVILVYMVMAAQFESLRHPFVILLTIPLAGVGAVILLLVLGMPFNIMSYIGIIMLAGIAVNDSIILVDRINQNRRGGQELKDAIINAGQTRVRPIIMTSVTTILALLPLTIGIGEGASLRAPMAVAVIGGLFTSTALTLVVIPSVYHMLAGRVRLSTESEQESE